MPPTPPLPRLPLGSPLLPLRPLVTSRHAARPSDGASPLQRALRFADAMYRTDRPELLDRDDTTAERRQQIILALDRAHRRLRTYDRFCSLLRPAALATGPRPHILEIASGHGELAIALDRDLRTRGFDPLVTGSDVMPELVELASENARRSGSAAQFRRLDATALELDDDSIDLAVNALVLHHLGFDQVVQALRELRRVARTAVLIDLLRSPLLFAPVTLAVGALSGSVDCVHDGAISMRKAWSVADWRVAIERAGWERARIGLLLPAFVVVQLER